MKDFIASNNKQSINLFCTLLLCEGNCIWLKPRLTLFNTILHKSLELFSQQLTVENLKLNRYSWIWLIVINHFHVNIMSAKKNWQFPQKMAYQLLNCYHFPQNDVNSWHFFVQKWRIIDLVFIFIVIMANQRYSCSHFSQYGGHLDNKPFFAENVNN